MGAAKVTPSLSGKSIVGFLLVAIPAVATVGGISFYALRDLNLANRDLQEISRSLDAVRALDAAVGRALVPLRESGESAAGANARFATAMRDIEADLQSCGNTACHGASAQPREMAQRLAPYMRAIRDGASELARTDAAERAHLVRGIDRAGADVSLQLQRMSGALLGRVQALQERSEAVYDRTWRLIAGAIVVVVPLAMLVGYVLLRQLMIAQQVAAQREWLQTAVAAKTVELEQAHASLMRSEKLASIGVLAAGVAHELNNPLTSVLMNVNLLIEDLEDRPDIQRELKRIGEDTLRCQRIIDELRDFSRRPELQIRPCDLNGLIDDVLTLTQRQLDIQKITLARNLAPHLPAVACDADRMRQVLLNILVNAIQATPRGGRVAVETGLADGCAVITVSDSGPGIAPDIRSRIFDPFFTTKAEGSGLGLSIVHRIMEEHRGKVEIRSVTPGEAPSAASATAGTAVRLLLPTAG